MIEVEKLYKSFDKNEVLKGIDISLNSNKITAILGPNGSGKTTLIKCILGMVLPDKGSIKIFGEPIHNKWQYRDRISYLPQIAKFPENLKVKELLNMVKGLRTAKADDSELIRQFDLMPFMEKKVSKLSGGTVQRVNLLLAFMYDNPVIILDEPSTGLDPVALIQLKQIVKQMKAVGKKIIITTHIMSLVEALADEIIFLLEGKIYFKGSIEALKEMHHEQDLEAAIADILRAHKTHQS